MTAATRLASAERLTDTAIRAWLKTGSSDALHDGGGLYLRRRGAAGYWALRQVNATNGARTWAGLFPGVPYPDATLQAARRKAIEARLRAADAPTDLVRERQQAKEAERVATVAAALATQRRLTVRTLFDRWQATALKPQTLADGTRTGRKDGGEWVKAAFERRLFQTLGAVAAADVTRADLLAILDECKAGGQRRTANVLLTDLRQMFAFAADRDIVPRNPLDGIRRAAVGGKDVERDRTLSEGETMALWAAVPDANMNARSAAAIWLILATACRVGEAMAARWEHVDLERRTWFLPETKNERDHLIHLSPFAVQQFEKLAALQEMDADGKTLPWVFPNAAGNGGVCVKSFGKQLADRQRLPEHRLANRAKNTTALTLAGGRWTAHDLRRTAATMMAGLGIGTDVIDECLNHKLQSKVARVYIKDRRLSQQAHAFEALGARLTTLTTGEGAATNIVALRTAVA
jgi:integrase